MANRTKQAGLLGSTKTFLSRAGKLSACAVTPPIDMDKKAATDAAGSLCSEQARSLEIWWDGPNKTLQVVLVSEAQDMDRFRADVTGIYPGAAFSNLGQTVPEWYDPATSTYRIFDVGTRHGHYTAVYDTARPHQLLTQVAGAVQSYEYAWVQIVFAKYDLTGPLDAHARRLNARYKEIRRGNYVSTYESLLSNAKPHEHPELGHDYVKNCSRLQKDTLSKKQGGQILLSVRGMVRGDSDIRLPIDMIGVPPARSADPPYESLSTYQYEYGLFHSDNKKSRIKIPRQKHASQRIEIFESRLLPAPRQLLEKARKLYFDKNLFGRYRQRPPLPFVILSPSEMSLFAHLPDPSTPNMGITRGGSLPRPSGKTGASIGFFESGDS